MRMRIPIFILSLLALTLRATEPAAPPTLEKLRFLAGCWEQTEGNRVVQENWTAPRGGLMLGTGRTVKADQALFFEFLRIVRDDQGIAYIAQPKGGPAVRFPLVRLEKHQVVFENPAHDFPQRITYRRHGRRMFVAVESMTGDLRELFHYRRVACPG